MITMKCKMCGGDMNISVEKSLGVCEYCGSTMTIPKVDDEQRLAAFNRGNHFRRIGEFDKALSVYEQIVSENSRDAEAHWCCALCRFGIEYVEDPVSLEWLPTCHRVSFDNFLEDVDYLAAVEYSDGVTRRQYQKDAAKIAEVQRGILATSQKEEPFDIFICYKESDENGQRTVDSTLAQDIYYQLTDEGWRVFFSRITLEDKGGAEYEPYIFAALNSAKVMVVVGTSAENLNAVWVKNEWSRFLNLMKRDRSKLFLPCYRDMDPYDLPDQLSVLQSYDMSKIGFIQDLIHGINKVLAADRSTESPKETVFIQGEGGNVNALLKRGYIELEDGEWNKANTFFDRVLDQDAECAEAYLGKALAEAKVTDFNQFQKLFLPSQEQIKQKNVEVIIEGRETREEELITENIVPGYLERESIRLLFEVNLCYVSCADSYEERMNLCLQRLAENRNFCRAEQYARGEFKTKITAFNVTIKKEMEQTLRRFRAEDEQSETEIRERYEQKFREWGKKIEQLRLDSETHREKYYQETITLFEEKKYDQALICFQSSRLKGYQRSEDYIFRINKIIADEKKRQSEEAVRLHSQKKRRKTRNIIISVSTVVVVVAVVWIFSVVHARQEETDRLENDYNTAVSLYDAGDYGSAAMLFASLDSYADSKQLLENSWNNIAQRDTISCGYYFTLGLKTDGTVIATGDNSDGQCDVSEWEDIVSISAGYDHSVGLKTDGTVVAAGDNSDGQCNVSEWENIVSVSAGNGHSVGLKTDGTLVAAGNNSYGGPCNVSEWEDIVAISAGGMTTVGLKKDGTVVATGSNTHGQCNVSEWEDIVSISVSDKHTVGLKSDGTVVAVGSNAYGQCDVSEWEDIVAISAGYNHTVGLKSDGTLVAVGNDVNDQCDVSAVEGIVRISAGAGYTLGLKSDGTIVVIGITIYDQDDIFDWTDIKE